MAREKKGPHTKRWGKQVRGIMSMEKTVSFGPRKRKSEKRKIERSLLRTRKIWKIVSGAIYRGRRGIRNT